MRALAEEDGMEHFEKGDFINNVFQSTQKVLEASYGLPYLARTCMEPMNCTVHVRSGAVEVWASSQKPLSYTEPWQRPGHTKSRAGKDQRIRLSGWRIRSKIYE